MASQLASSDATSSSSSDLASGQRHVHTDGSYLTANDPRIHVGLGEHDALEDVRITWPDGSEATLSRVPAGSILRIDPGN